MTGQCHVGHMNKTQQVNVRWRNDYKLKLTVWNFDQSNNVKLYDQIFSLLAVGGDFFLVEFIHKPSPP